MANTLVQFHAKEAARTETSDHDVSEKKYHSFAAVYDILMDNVDYNAWGVSVIQTLRRYGIRDGIVLDLACGTGTMTEILAGAGYDMIGADASSEMLQEALEKRDNSGHDILYICQDMRELELYGTVRAVVCVCDSINYLTDDKSLLQVFRLVHNYLDPGGIFLFDFNTEKTYAGIGTDTIAESRAEGSFIWENEYDEDTGLNECRLTVFAPAGGGLYSREEEIHLQKAYDLEHIKTLLRTAGLSFLEAHDGYSEAPPSKKSERISVVARECKK